MSCKKEDEKVLAENQVQTEKPNKGTKETKSKTPAPPVVLPPTPCEKIKGTWRKTSESVNGKSISVDKCGEEYTFTGNTFALTPFTSENGKCINLPSTKGTFIITGKNINITHSENTVYSYTFEIKTNTLTLTSINPHRGTIIEIWTKK